MKVETYVIVQVGPIQAAAVEEAFRTLLVHMNVDQLREILDKLSVRVAYPTDVLELPYHVVLAVGPGPGEFRCWRVAFDAQAILSGNKMLLDSAEWRKVLAPIIPEIEEAWQFITDQMGAKA